MLRSDMSKLKDLMALLFPVSYMYSDHAHNDDNFVHYLNMSTRLCGDLHDDGSMVLNCENIEENRTVIQKTVNGEWRDVMNVIMDIAEQAHVASVFYQ